MASIVLKSFSGEIPKLEPHLLPNDAAQQAINCKFVSGALQPLKQGTLLATMSNNPVRSIFTLDGTGFFTWTESVRAFLGPVIDDTYGRVYYSTQSGFRVTRTAYLSATGGNPSTSYLVGVPRPPVAPTVSVSNRTSWPTGDTVTYSAKVYLIDNSSKAETGGWDMTEATKYRSYNYTLLTSSLTNQTVKVVIKATNVTKGNKLIFTLTSVQGSQATAKIVEAIPGGVSTTNSGQYDANGNIDTTTLGPVLTTSGSNTTITVDLQYGTFDTRVYTVTYVNAYGEESENSPPATIAVDYLQDVSVSWSYDTTLFNNYVPPASYYVYRTLPNGDFAAVKTAQSLPGSTGTITFTDDVGTIKEVVKILESQEWFMPNQSLRGLTLMQNGFFVGFNGKNIYFSEPYRPHAWPYSMTLPYNVVAIAALNDEIVVTTEAFPYVIRGAHPKAMRHSQISVQQAGVGQDSIETVDSQAIYASNDGIVVVNPGGSASLEESQTLFDRLTWRARYGSVLGNFRFAVHNGALFAANSTIGNSFVLRLDERGGEYVRMDSSFYADGVYVQPKTDQMYYSQGQLVYTFETSASGRTFDWWSKDFLMQHPTNFGAGYINGSGTITLQVYCDGVLKVTKNLSQGYFRLPNGFLARRISVRLQGTGKVNEFYLTSSFQELRNVV